MTLLNPYITFKDQSKQAMEFYKSVLGGELTMTTYKEGGMSQSSEDENLIMHSMLVSPSGLTLMGSDTPPSMEFGARGGMGISISGEDEKELRGYWEKLAEGATVTMPFEKAPWGDIFGMLDDKFGVSWMINVSGSK